MNPHTADKPCKSELQTPSEFVRRALSRLSARGFDPLLSVMGEKGSVKLSYSRLIQPATGGWLGAVLTVVHRVNGRRLISPPGLVARYG